MNPVKNNHNLKIDLHHCNYQQLLNSLADQSIDLICVDPPYGKINGMQLSGQKQKVNWDVQIDWKVMFDHFNRVVKPGGTIVCFGKQPTYSQMILANLKDFKYELIWIKNNGAQGFHAKKCPCRLVKILLFLFTVKLKIIAALLTTLQL